MLNFVFPTKKKKYQNLNNVSHRRKMQVKGEWNIRDMFVPKYFLANGKLKKVLLTLSHQSNSETLWKIDHVDDICM